MLRPGWIVSFTPLSPNSGLHATRLFFAPQRVRHCTTLGWSPPSSTHLGLLKERTQGAGGSGRGRRTLTYKQLHNIQLFTSCTGKNLKSLMLCSVGKAVGKRALTYFWCEYKFAQPIWRAFGSNHKNCKCMYPFSR